MPPLSHKNARMIFLQSCGPLLRQDLHPVALLDASCRLVAANARWYSDFGVEESRAVGCTLDAVLQRGEGGFSAAWQQCCLGERQSGREERFRNAEGQLIPCDWELHPCHGDDGSFSGALLFCRAPSESGRTALDHRCNEERLALALQAAQLGVWDLDLPSGTLVWSPLVHEIVGAWPAEMTLKGVEALTHPEDRAKVRAQFEESIQQHREFNTRCRVLLPDGSVRWVQNLGRAIYDESARPVRFIGTVRNITELIAEEDGTARSHRLSSLARLSAGVAHDINNILAPVVAGASLLLCGDQSAHDREMLELIQQSAERGADIIKQLLAFGRGINGEQVPVSLSSLISEVRSLIKGSLPAGIRLRCSFETTDDAVLGDRRQLAQALVSLCVNAREAMPEGGLLELRLEGFEASELFCRSTPEARPGSYVVLSVVDNGLGIAPEHLDRIFEPFFTTKDVAVRSGLGLSSVLGIVRSHRGFLQVRSRQGEGTTVKAFLPHHRGGAIPVPAPSEPAELPRGQGERILVVDDEEGVREIIREILGEAGYVVVDARDGVEGLALFRREPGCISAVITDLLMPNMDGFRLVEELHRTRPGLPVLAISGTLQLACSKEITALGSVFFLSKPFSTQELLGAVHAAVRSPA